MTKLLILSAPPASGKTFWIENFQRELSEKILVISPLRALANECKAKWNDSISVMTPEEYLLKQEAFDVVIFDEIHLLFYWGDSFRDRMWQAFYEISLNAQFIIGLTATFSDPMQEEIKKFQLHFEEIHWANFGNQSLKYLPNRYFKIPSKNLMSELIENANSGVKLVFCAYRNEVFDLSLKLESLGFKVWSCVGGEAHRMQEFLKSGDLPDYIVSTTVLSHGVNLPEIKEIYFLYPTKNVDFWVQMVARGGRRGQSYKVYALENPFGIPWNPFTNFLQVLLLRLKVCFNLGKRQIYLWFLKD